MAAKKKTAKIETPKVDLVETMFKTDTITMNPDLIKAITLQGNQIVIYYGYNAQQTLKAPAEKDADGKPVELELYTKRWAEALEKKEEYKIARMEKYAELHEAPQAAVTG